MDKKTQIVEYYDTVATVYDTKHGVVLDGQKYNFDTHYEPFLAKWVPSGGRALELGCGTGVYTKWLVERGCTVEAVDISEGMLAQARERCPAAAFHAGDCEDPASITPSIAQGGFDAVVGINTYSYYPNKEKALANYHALLKPGGRFIVIDMYGASLLYRIMHLMNKNEMRQWLGEISELDQSNVQAMAARTGFTVETIERFAFVPNGVSAGAVSLLKPFDRLFRAIRVFDFMAMRIAFSLRRGP